MLRADPHPGNIAVDAEGGGRLVYYDFGMMGTIPGDVRAGLLELFYGVYQKVRPGCQNLSAADWLINPAKGSPLTEAHDTLVCGCAAEGRVQGFVGDWNLGFRVSAISKVPAHRAECSGCASAPALVRQKGLAVQDVSGGMAW